MMQLNISKYNGRADLRNHLDWLANYEKIISELPICKAAAILGSFAKGHPDRLSDIDILIWCDQSDLKSAADILFSRHPYELIHKWEREFSPDHFFGKYIYGNFFSAEIHVLSMSSEFRLRRPFLVLKDDGILLSRVEDGEPPNHEAFEALGAGVDGLGWELFDMLKWWQRGQPELVKGHLKKIVAKLNDLESDGK